MRDDFPFMPLYVRDWLTGEATTSMTPEQRGAFADLLARAWTANPPCSIPDDDALLAKWSGLERRWKTAGALVKKQFAPMGDGRLRNDKQWAVYGQHHKEREGNQLGADKTNAKRWGKRNDSESLSDHLPIARASDSDSDSVSKSGENQNQNHGELSPQQQAVATILGALESFATGFVMPVGGRAAKWAQEYGAQWVAEVIRDVGSALDNKGASYLQAILRERHGRGWKPLFRELIAPADRAARDEEAAKSARNDAIRASVPMNRNTPEVVEYLAEIRDQFGQIRDGALTYDEWQERKTRA